MSPSDVLGTFRHAITSLMRVPVLAATAVVTLGLGIGVNSAMFTVLDTVFRKPLPFHEPDQLVLIWTDLPDQGSEASGSSYADFADWREQATSFAGMAALWTFPNGDVNLAGGTEPQRVSVARITPGFFAVLGVRPLHGREFVEEESILGNHRRAILSHGLWSDHFGADPTLVGRTVMVNGVSYSVVGIMPRELERRAVRALGTEVQLWRPLVPEDNQTGGRGSRRLRVVGRLKTGIAAAQANAELDGIATRIAAEYPATNRDVGVRVTPLREQVVADAGRGLLFLFGAVLVVLAGACVNVATLLLIKGASRRKQIAVQRALGASRARIAAGVAAEALVLGAGGALLGIVLALAMVSGFRAFAPADIPFLPEARVDLTVLAFAIIATIGSGLFAAVAPAWRATRVNGTISLRQQSSRQGSRVDRRTMQALTTAQIALAMLLMSTGGVLIRSFEDLLRTDPGFESAGVLTFQLELPMAATASYPQQSQRDAFFETLLQRAEAIPGVTDASIASAPPLEEDPIVSPLRLPGDPAGTSRQASFRMVSRSYFDLLRMPVREGRSFAPADVRGSPLVVVLSDALARSLWPGQSAVGKRIALSGEREAEVIGVTSDVRTAGLDEDVGRIVYLVTDQGSYNFMTVLVRTSSEPASLVPTVRRVVKELDPDLPLHRIRALDQMVAASIAHQRFQVLLVSGFSLLMLALAVVGTFGVTAYGVSERHGELAVRAALGASPRRLQRLVAAEAALLATIGILLGCVLAVSAAGILTGLIGKVNASDSAALAAVAVLLGVTIVTAAFIPGRRAARADPLHALRSE